MFSQVSTTTTKNVERVVQSPIAFVRVFGVFARPQTARQGANVTHGGARTAGERAQGACGGWREMGVPRSERRRPQSNHTASHFSRHSSPSTNLEFRGDRIERPCHQHQPRQDENAAAAAEDAHGGRLTKAMAFLFQSRKSDSELRFVFFFSSLAVCTPGCLILSRSPRSLFLNSVQGFFYWKPLSRTNKKGN